MFDIGFSEMMVIAVVALIVIGPERLPGVARTMGHLLGRLQRYVSDVKSDIQREMHVEELKKIQSEVEQQARGIERTVVGEMQAVETTLNAGSQSLAEIMDETGQKPAAAGAAMLSDFEPGERLPPQPLPEAVPAVVAEAAIPVAGESAGKTQG